ncbi:MAG TPA: SDR family oxidoreductase [Vitreimonas sp.]|uniref:SDR family oxidoreductase n=1 Tax=Vitreimonas sp. TaxID=3069702 RepID=UPI002D61254B|nr:SDR family oxidoreductase [Vitreimonas sp.]HYD86843.1 SDR family oxidoreductase [Vitreimonas sp.]
MSKNSLDRAVVVTGASTGIGRAAVASAGREGAHVFASVRKQADADSLRAEFGEAVTPLLFDVADEAAVRAGAAQVAAALGDRRLFGLVNNAGIAVPGPLLHLDTEELRRQFEINLFGVHNVTRAFADLLGADPQRQGKPGRIVMISSVGGQNGSPFVGPYSSSKFALEGYSQSLRRELLLYGIDVIVIGPGAIATPIWDKAEANDLNRFANTPYGPMLQRVADYMLKQGREGLPPSAVGDLIWRCLSDPKPKVRYPILRRPFMDRTLPRLMNPRTVDKIIAKRLGYPNRS